MKWVILIGLAIIVVFEALFEISKKADEDAERMYREWVKKHDRTDGTDDI